ncbi:MAG: DUF1648 domain-containing protein [Telluria sp.]
MFVIASCVIHVLPAGAQIAIHWGPDGQPDAWVGQWSVLLVIPIVSSVIWFLLSVVPQAFSVSRRPIQPVHPRFTRVFLILVAAQILIAIDALRR